MNMLIPDAGKIKAVEEVFRATGSREGFSLRLFTDPAAVTDTDLLDNYSIADFGGYANIAIARSSFEVAVIVGERATLLRLPAPSWTMTSGAPQTVNGWLLVGDTTDTIYAGQTFDVPHTFTVGATLTLDPFQIQCATIPD